MTAPRILVAAALAVAFLPAAARAAAPPNDRFAAAQALAGDSGTTTGTNVGSGAEFGEPVPRPGGRTSVWYRWTASFTGLLLVDTCGSGFDTVLGIYRGDALGTLAELAANDDGCGTGSRAGAAVEHGAVYHFVVSGHEDSAGPLVLRWGRAQPPANDRLDRAVELTGPEGRVTGASIGATADAGEPEHAGSGASIWYRWIAPFSGSVTFDSCESSFASRLTALAGDPPVDVEARARGFDDECGTTESRIAFTASAGSTYVVAIDGAGGASGDVTLSWLLVAPPANDGFAGPQPVAGLRGFVTATSDAATREEGEPDHGGTSTGGSVWFRWRAPRSAAVAFRTCESDFDTVMAVYVGSRLSRLRLVGSNDDSCPDDAGSVVVIRARRGVVYSIAVDGYGTGSLTLAWGSPRGWRECAVPDLRGLTLPEARKALDEGGCRLGRVEGAASALVPRGRILEQYPFPSRRLPFDTPVAVLVSTGSRR